MPPHVEYKLTPLGREAEERVRAMADWIEVSLPRIRKARGVQCCGRGSPRAVKFSGRQALAPAKAGGDVLQDRLDDVGVVVDTELIGDGQEQRVSLCDGFVF